MKSMKGYRKQKAVLEIKFDAMTGPGGFVLDYNKISKRFDLRQNGSLHYSHMASIPCINIARSRFDVEMAVPNKETK